MLEARKVLVVAPHMDDEILGCGATLRKHVLDGDEVKVCFVAHRIYGHTFDDEKNKIEEGHALDAKNILGYSEVEFLRLHDERLDACLQDIIIPLEESILQFRPNVLYGPFRGDNNQDHRAVYDALRVAIRPFATPFLKEVYLYETPSSTEQSLPLIDSVFMPNHYVDVTHTIDAKIDSFHCYKTESRETPHPRAEASLRALAQKRGSEIGFNSAEAFMKIRSKWT